MGADPTPTPLRHEGLKVTLSDGSCLVVPPLTLRHLKRYGHIVRRLNDPQEDEQALDDFLFVIALSLGRNYPEFVVSEERTRDALEELARTLPARRPVLEALVAGAVEGDEARALVREIATALLAALAPPTGQERLLDLVDMQTMLPLMQGAWSLNGFKRVLAPAVGNGTGHQMVDKTVEQLTGGMGADAPRRPAPSAADAAAGEALAASQLQRPTDAAPTTT